MSYKISIAALGLGLLVAACTATEPRIVQMGTVLSAGQEVPPTNSPANGKGLMTFDRDTRQLSWEIEYAGLTGPLQAAHFHGPAAAGANAGVQVPIPVTGSPLKGSAVLTEAQAADLLDGRLYVNLHTPQFPAGEVRGQVVRAASGAAEVSGTRTAPYYAPPTPPQMGEPTQQRY